MLPFKMHNYMSCVLWNIFQRNRIFHPIGPFRFYVTFSMQRGLFLLSFGLLFKLLCSLLFLYPMKRTTCTSIRRSPGYLATHKLRVRFFSQKRFHNVFFKARWSLKSYQVALFFSANFTPTSCWTWMKRCLPWHNMTQTKPTAVYKVPKKRDVYPSTY